MHAHRLSERDQALDLVGVRARYGERRQRHTTLHVARRAGVDKPMAVSADRAQQECDRAALRRLLRSLGARRHRDAIPGAVLGAHHALGHHGDLAVQRGRRRSLQIAERRERHHVAVETGGRGGRRLAERGNDERLRAGRDELRCLRAAHPRRHRKALDAHVLEAECFEARSRPRGRLLLVGRARRSWSEARRELAHPGVGNTMARHGGIAQLHGHDFRRGWYRGGGGGGGGAGTHGEQEEADVKRLRHGGCGAS